VNHPGLRAAALEWDHRGVTVYIVFAVLILLVVFVVWMIHSTSDEKRRQWAEAADALGLVVERRVPEGHVLPAMVGDRHGQPVRLGVLVTRKRYIADLTYVETPLPRLLALGLKVFRREGLGSGPIPFGDRYVVWGSPRERAHALVAVPELHDALMSYAKAEFGISLSDTAVRLQAPGFCFRPRQLERELDRCIALAQTVIRAAESLGPSDIQRAVDAGWRPIADARRLTLEGLVMSGRCAGVHVEVKAIPRDDECDTSLTVRFDRPLELGLSLERHAGTGALDRLLRGAEDIETGTAAFDARFMVQGNESKAVRAALTATVRARLLELDERAAVTLNDELLRADASVLLSDPEQLDAAITAITQAGAELTGISEAEGAGPYRR
jgi:hypothetical protein